MTRLSVVTADLFVDRQNDIVFTTHPVNNGQLGKIIVAGRVHTKLFGVRGSSSRPFRSGKTVVFLVKQYASVMSSENQHKSKVSPPSSPRHVAIIMDGNGRWAKSRGRLRIFGHQAGVQSVRRAVSFAVSHHFEALTLYAFSSENWNRASQEVSALMELFVQALDSEVKSLHRHNVRLRIIGDTSRFGIQLQERIRYSEAMTCNNSGLTLNIAANYGGRWDIIQGVRQLTARVQEGALRPDQIDEDALCQVVCMNELAPVDLVIRTGGEYRISNFLLWQIAYAELFFTDILWPDFDDVVFEGALNTFAQRKRRFGGTTPNDANTS